MKPDLLAGLLKRLYKNFDMSEFADRLKVQKFIYILQNRGINLGYLYNFYLYGPYSTDLTRTAFQIEDYASKGKVKFTKPAVEKKFNEIISKLQNHKDEMRWLEGASSILFLADMGYRKEGIYRQLGKKKNPFKRDEIDKIWQELEQWRWIK